MFDIFKGRSDGGSLDGPQDHIGKAEDYGSNNDGGEDSSREGFVLRVVIVPEYLIGIEQVQLGYKLPDSLQKRHAC